MQRYSTCCIILWKNTVFSWRRLRTLACIDFGVLLAPFGRVWVSKLGPCWDRLGLHWTSSCDFWCLLGDLGALHWFWTWIGIDYRAMATKNAVLEASRLDFGALRPWFWRVKVQNQCKAPRAPKRHPKSQFEAQWRPNLSQHGPNLEAQTLPKRAKSTPKSMQASVLRRRREKTLFFHKIMQQVKWRWTDFELWQE